MKPNKSELDDFSDLSLFISDLYCYELCQKDQEQKYIEYNKSEWRFAEETWLVKPQTNHMKCLQESKNKNKK